MTSHVLREYAVLADGCRGVVVGPRGDFTWMCAPGWADEPVFSTLVGGAGTYVVRPEGTDFVWGGYYQPGTLVWCSRWVTADNAVIECREALALPADPGGAVVLRQVVCREGQARVAVRLDPRAGFTDRPAGDLTREADVWTARVGEHHLRWSGGERAVRRNHGLELELDLSSGERHDLVLEVSTARPSGPTPDPGRAWVATVHQWEAETPTPTTSIAPDDSRHAYAVLRGLTLPGGGMVAAATTALPERAQTGRNYDYRYSWIRDQCFAGQAIAADGPHPLLDDAVDFVAARLIGAAGLRAVARVAPARQSARWETFADRLVADVGADCLHPSGRWQRHPDDDRVDASLLLAAVRGAVPADDPRSQATLDAVSTDLVDDFFCYRFRHDDRPLSAAEGAFVMCGFDMALALHQQGREAEAARFFERNRTACGPPGLFSEEYDVNQRQMRGNLPQAFVHALMFEAARRLAEPWRST